MASQPPRPESPTQYPVDDPVPTPVDPKPPKPADPMAPDEPPEPGTDPLHEGP